MRNVEIKNNSDWTPLKVEHEHDPMIRFKRKEITPIDSIKFISSEAQQTSVDCTFDQHSSYILTDRKKIDKIIDVQLLNKKYPEQFTTSLLANAYPTPTSGSAYLLIREETIQSPRREYVMGDRTADGITDTTYTWFQDTNSNAIYFNITLIDENVATVSHDDNYSNVFLTLTGAPHNDDAELFFEIAPLNTPTEDQKLNYYINNDYSFIVFYKKLDGVTYYLQPEVGTGVFKLLDSRTLADEMPSNCVIKFVKYTKNTNSQTMMNNWVSYQLAGNQNNLNVNGSKSYYNVTNNYLLNSQFYNIVDDVLPVNVTQLKNQIAPDGSMNRDNPFPNLRDCDHREYEKIFFEKNGMNTGEFHLGYNSYVTEVTLPPDTITYFNTPQDMYPYTKINVNDSGLVQSGAIGGDTPATADKLFKKAANYKYNTPYGNALDEQTGVWLCCWLKSNVAMEWDRKTTFKQNIIVNFDGKVYRARSANTARRPDAFPDIWEETDQPPPVWVDRYYNPEKFSAVQAMSYEDNSYAAYTPKFDHIVSKLNAGEIYVFDKKSDLTFEPGCLYAYYRYGPGQIDVAIDTLREDLMHEGQLPVYKQDRSTYVNPNDFLTFTGEQYIQTDKPANIKDSDFTISFNMSMDDWTQPVGSQIIGNYTNQGVGVFNKQDTTPFMVFTTDQDVQIYNTSLQLINTIEQPGVVAKTRLTGSEDLTLYTDVSSVTYDMKGMLVETTLISQTVYYRNDDFQFEVIGTKPGFPGDIIRIEEQSEFSKNVYQLVDDYNSSNPEIPLTVVSSNSNLSNVVIESDIIITTNNTTGKIKHADVDEQHTYILDEFDNIYRYDTNNEQLDALNLGWPFHIIGSSIESSLGVAHKHPEAADHVTWEQSDSTFFQTSNYGGLQYRINCDCYTIDKYDQVWFAKRHEVYKYTLSDRMGVNASWRGVLGEGADRTETLLIATNDFNGSTGNEIELIGDGVKSLIALIDEWNAENQSNTVNLAEGDPQVVLPEGEEIKLEGGNDRGDAITSLALSANANIDNMLTSTDNHTYVCYGKSNIVKIDNLRNKLATYRDETTYTQSYMDMVTEFTNEHGYHKYIVLLNRVSDDVDTVKYTKLDAGDLSIITSQNINLPVGINLNNQFNVTNHITNNKICKPISDTNHLTFKFRYQSYFDSDKTLMKNIHTDVSDLSPGYHHFAYSFNSINSNISLFIDGILQEIVASDDVASGAAYKYSSSIHDPIMVGAEPFFNNVTLSEHLGLQNYNFANGFSLNNYRVFNKYLNFQKIKMLSREGRDVQPVRLTIPIGRRNFIDNITTFYKNRPPGNKSNKFDISVVNQTLTSTELQNYMTNNIKQQLNPSLPINTQLDKIQWTS